MVTLALIASGCGYVGDTKPPTLDMPLQVTDLRAGEYGSKIAIEFTLAPLTTEGLPLKNLRSVEARITGDGVTKIYPISSRTIGPISDDISAQDWVGKQITIAVRATGPKGKSPAWSNAVTLAVGPPLATPTSVEAKSAPDGVQLTWTGAGPGYRIYRANGDGMPERLAESSTAAYLDSSARFDSKYRYIIQTLDGESRQSEVSSVVEITPKDEFPPAAPAGFSAVAGGEAIELSWERSPEEDLAGYNVYRSVDGAAFEKIAGPIAVPVYSDRSIEVAKRYRYAVSAVDMTGNESARSAIAEVTPQ